MENMRLALLGLAHETNTFSQIPTSYERFSGNWILRGQEIVREYRDADSAVAGFLEAGCKFGADVVPLIFASNYPTGTITKDAFDRIVGEMLQLLEDNGPWDGVLLAQHGAAVSEEFPDADGEICARTRTLVGPDVPIGMSLDMHGNLTRDMIVNTTASVLYRTNPHLDARARALECAEIIVRAIKGEVRPVQALETPPMVINIIRQNTAEEPMLGVMRDVEDILGRPAMLSASAGEGFPYADVNEMGMSFLAVSDGDETAARTAARWMAGHAWDRREQFMADIPSIAEALKSAAASQKKPVVLMDVGDNVGGGGPSDSTFILEGAKRLGVKSFLQALCDPEAVAACVVAGVGADITLEVGSKTDDMHGSPVAVTGRVRTISDGKYEDPTPTHGGYRFYDAGTMVVLETTDDHTLVLTSLRDGNLSRQLMYSVGIRPEEKQIVVAKGVVSPRPAYEPIAASIILVNTPGVTTADLSTFDYKRRRRPLYPFEQDTRYSPGETI